MRDKMRPRLYIKTYKLETFITGSSFTMSWFVKFSKLPVPNDSSMSSTLTWLRNTNRHKKGVPIINHKEISVAVEKQGFRPRKKRIVKSYVSARHRRITTKCTNGEHLRRIRRRERLRFPPHGNGRVHPGQTHSVSSNRNRLQLHLDMDEGKTD